MDITLHWWAALIGLALAIVLILYKLNATYSLMLGAIVGCLLGGASLSDTVNVLVSGTQSVMGTVLRVLAAGVLAGVMMESGAAERISRAIVNGMGDKLAILSLALATMIICAIGVFIPVAVLIVAPIAIEVGSKLHISKLALLVALSGGGKAGNIISPNPNAIAAASGFKVHRSDVMVGSYIPALFGLLTAVLLASLLKHHGTTVTMADMDAQERAELAEKDLPSLGRALVAPIVAIGLLILGPIGSVTNIGWLEKCQFDALYILPLAAIIGMLAMGKGRHVLEYTKSGLGRMVDVVMILIGAGTIGGLISASDLPQQIEWLIKAVGVPGTLLVPDRRHPHGRGHRLHLHRRHPRRQLVRQLHPQLRRHPGRRRHHHAGRRHRHRRAAAGQLLPRHRQVHEHDPRRTHEGRALRGLRRPGHDHRRHADHHRLVTRHRNPKEPS
ncbi:MAG: TRAP transporter large permease subunit [Bifidobacterium sp.]|nr:TRAP transporter large permease subunit [Bifidobacterium sp.]